MPTSRLSPVVRPAAAADVPSVVRLYAHPEDGNVMDRGAASDDAAFAEAFSLLAADPGSTLFVAVLDDGVVGTFHLAVIQYVAYRGGKVGMIENVHVDAALRSRGIGEAMMRFAIEVARERGCFRVQLTSHKRRTDAHRFYERLGFVRTHEGFKLAL